MNRIFFLGTFFSSMILSATQTVDDYFNEAMAHKQQGDNDKAILCFQKGLAYNPRHFDTNFHLACEYYYKGLYDNAIIHYEKALSINPNSGQTYFNLGIILGQHKNKKKEAYELFNKAIACNPNYAKAYFHSGKILEELGNADYAITYYRQAIALKDDYIDAYSALAKLLRDKEECTEAIAVLEQAISLEPHNVKLLFDLAFSANMIGQTEKAIIAYKNILLLGDNHAQSFYNLGYTFKLRGDLNEAIEMYTCALRLKPDYADARFALSLAYLNNGSFAQGWKEYEDYLKKNNLNSDHLRLWLEQNKLEGKHIILREQGGFGDTIQFIRYAQELKKRGAYITVVVRKPLLKILSGCTYIDELIEHGQSFQTADEQATLMALPAIFNSTEENIPNNIPYLFSEKTLDEKWKKIVQSSGKKLNIGLCWTPNLQNDSHRHPVARRSISLDLLEPLSKYKDVTFYSLQKENDNLQNTKLNIMTFNDFDESNGAFMDSAALIKNLDLVITVDTAIAHLAGALGAPVWLLLPFNVDWRWIVNRSDSPWYPTMRIFKQQKPMNWHPVVKDIVTALDQLTQTNLF